MAYHYATMGANVLVTARRESVLKKVNCHCIYIGEQIAYHYARMGASLMS